MTLSEKENTLLSNKHILICVGDESLNLNTLYKSELDYIKKNFCGMVVSNIDDANALLSNHWVNGQNYSPSVLIYLCGDISEIYKNVKGLDNGVVYIIEKLSCNYSNESLGEYYEIDNGMVPINIHNVGLYFRNYFDSDEKDYYESITNEHTFQKLTESNKPNNAFRKGIYLSKVKNCYDRTQNVHTYETEMNFNLLRCSSNLSGPTDNFRETDTEIIDDLSDISQYFFEQKSEFNHVLAQIYENSKTASLYYYIMTLINYIWLFIFGKVLFNIKTKNTEKKAKIKSHSDKTKDMPTNGLMAFCTFYKSYSNNKFNDTNLKHIKSSKDDMFDYCYNNASVLTQLHFKLKNTVNDENLVKKFTVTLYPNSVFIIPLSTNRLYTHEIRPSSLAIEKIPTRMGYVVRCSKTKAIFKDNQTYIDANGTYVPLEKPTDDNIKKLKDMYLRENLTDDVINYGTVTFSMNNGDYKKPMI